MVVGVEPGFRGERVVLYRFQLGFLVFRLLQVETHIVVVAVPFVVLSHVVEVEGVVLAVIGRLSLGCILSSFLLSQLPFTISGHLGLFNACVV